ncbi:gluconokinase [Hoyosella sp. YIM 151337]|uniref:gluconokinase n=1 Tax=Hoyosella sp. YIM 151337 TaxID=2992742 RepID=UPI002235C7B3|nr:gluconokinase [Hoyosella sp. YIM 151337]MCW4352018.1 gluconokinase [Hoyosella sp. YIM 151337]
MPAESPRTALVVMGVAGVGKTTTASLLARELGWKRAEADEFHPQANIDKMSAGIPLGDDDRTPWLRAIRDWITDRAEAGENVVLTCSALKRSYRDVLREANARVRFVFLHGPAPVVAERIGQRSGHFMPPSLLNSQFGDLEPLQSDEDGVTVDLRDNPERIVTCALTALNLAGPGVSQ